MPQGHGHSPHRILTVIEGRGQNRPMVDGFATEAKKRGWGFCQLLGINSDRIARLDFDDTPLDYVIFRELSRNNYHEVERLMLWLKANHKICINVDVTGRRISTSDKHFQQGLFMMDPVLKQYALPTFEAKTKANVLAYVGADRIHYPFVLKPRRGTAGKGIILIRQPEDLDQVKDFSGFLIEQYIEPECDWRVFVIGGTAVGTMRKFGDPDHPGDFRAWSAGRKKVLEETPEVLDALSSIATRAAAVSRLEYAGVDIIKEAKTGRLYLLETNLAAGWSNNFIPVTNINIPALVLDWFEDIDEGRRQPLSLAVQEYLSKRLKYLPAHIQETCEQISRGDPGALNDCHDAFASYPHDYLYDTGTIYDKLSHAYQELTREDVTSDPTRYQYLVQEIEAMPLSWAGNFIGPDLGILSDGAILSSLYLFLLHKTAKM